MSNISQVVGRAGVYSGRTAAFRMISNGDLAMKPGGGTIKGTKARDPNNTGYTEVLRAGTLMAKNATTGQYGVWAIGSLQANAAAAATSFTVSAAEAVEIVRRVGASGTLTGIGPPSAAGTVASISITYSAVNTSTGVVTCTALAAALVASSVVAEASFTTPTTFIPDGSGVVVPTDGTDADFSHIPIAGTVQSAQMLPYPADTALRTWIKERMSTLVGNKFVFLTDV